MRIGEIFQVMDWPVKRIFATNRR